jgi:arsenate reductase
MKQNNAKHKVDASQPKLRGIDSKTHTKEQRKLMLWILSSSFGLLVSFLFLVKLPNLKTLYPGLFDHDIVSVLLILMMMICVVLIAYGAFLYRSSKIEHEQEEIKTELSEIKKGFNKNPVLTLWLKFHTDSKETDKDARRATNIRFLFALALFGMGVLSFGLAFFNLTSKSVETVPLLVETGLSILGLCGGVLTTYFKSTDERKKENQTITGEMLVAAINNKLLPPHATEETTPVLLWSPACAGCRKAKNYLDEKEITYTLRDITDTKPTYEELHGWYSNSGLPIKRFFSYGKKYKELSLKDKLLSMDANECLRLLVTDALLLIHPMILYGDIVIPGFNREEWDKLFEKNL